MITAIKAVPYREMLAYKNKKSDLQGFINKFDRVWIISITNPDMEPLFLDEQRILNLQFDDDEPYNSKYVINPNNNNEEGSISVNPRSPIYFSKEMAKKVIDFLLMADTFNSQAGYSKDLLFINCMMGASRSGAIATWARQLCEIDYDYFKQLNPQIVPNSYVVRTLNDIYSNIDDYIQEEFPSAKKLSP